MTVMTWRPELSVEIQSLDTQHQMLVDLLNRLETTLCAGASKVAIQETLIEIVNHTINHFEFEENLLLENGYTDYAAHRKEHFALTNQVLRIPGDIIAGKELQAQELMAFLKDWLEDHILNVDKKYSALLRKKGIQ